MLAIVLVGRLPHTFLTQQHRQRHAQIAGGTATCATFAAPSEISAPSPFCICDMPNERFAALYYVVQLHIRAAMPSFLVSTGAFTALY